MISILCFISGFVSCVAFYSLMGYVINTNTSKGKELIEKGNSIVAEKYKIMSELASIEKQLSKAERNG